MPRKIKQNQHFYITLWHYTFREMRKNRVSDPARADPARATVEDELYGFHLNPARHGTLDLLDDRWFLRRAF